MDALIKEGIEMDRQYVYKYCSPTRSGIQVHTIIRSTKNITCSPAFACTRGQLLLIYNAIFCLLLLERKLHQGCPNCALKPN